MPGVVDAKANRGDLVAGLALIGGDRFRFHLGAPARPVVAQIRRPVLAVCGLAQRCVDQSLRGRDQRHERFCVRQDGNQFIALQRGFVGGPGGV